MVFSKSLISAETFERVCLKAVEINSPAKCLFKMYVLCVDWQAGICVGGGRPFACWGCAGALGVGVVGMRAGTELAVGQGASPRKQSRTGVIRASHTAAGWGGGKGKWRPTAPRSASQHQCQWGSSSHTAGLVQKGLRSTQCSPFPSSSTWILGLRPEAVVSQEDRAWGTVWAPLWLLRP